MTVCEIDLRAGGAYRYAWRRTDTGMEEGLAAGYDRLGAILASQPQPR